MKKCYRLTNEYYMTLFKMLLHVDARMATFDLLLY